MSSIQTLELKFEEKNRCIDRFFISPFSIVHEKKKRSNSGYEIRPIHFFFS